MHCLDLKCYVLYVTINKFVFGHVIEAILGIITNTCLHFLIQLYSSNTWTRWSQTVCFTLCSMAWNPNKHLRNICRYDTGTLFDLIVFFSCERKHTLFQSNFTYKLKIMLNWYDCIFFHSSNMHLIKRLCVTSINKHYFPS